MWLWPGIGAMVIVREEVPAAETLRVIGPTSGTSTVRVIRVRAPVTEGLRRGENHGGLE